MQQRQLGKTDITCGEVGLGCWQFGGDWGPMTEDKAFEIMQTAIDQGTDFFDTADVYGAGRSESFIGEFLKQTHAKLHVATKFGREAEVYPNQYTEAALRAGIQRSCRRLDLDVLDLVQLHCIPTAVMAESTIFDWLRTAQQDGLIKHFGASVETVDEALLCMQQDGLASLQIIFNIFRQKPIQELLPQAQKKGIGIIVRLPIASGLLAGKFTQDSTFAPQDHRTFNRDGQCFNVGETFAGLPFTKGVALADHIKSWVPDGMTMAQMALRWILDFDAVSVVIPGASSPQQALDNAKTSDLPPLSPELHQKLADFYTQEVHDHIRGSY